MTTKVQGGKDISVSEENEAELTDKKDFETVFDISDEQDRPRKIEGSNSIVNMCLYKKIFFVKVLLTTF